MARAARAIRPVQSVLLRFRALALRKPRFSWTLLWAPCAIAGNGPSGAAELRGSAARWGREPVVGLAAGTANAEEQGKTATQVIVGSEEAMKETTDH